MARPVNADAQATRQRVLESAAHLFSQRGLDGTSIRDVAKGAGVSLGVVHHYFGNKDGLYQACIASMYEELEEMRLALDPAFRSGGPLGDRIERVVREAFRFCREHRPAVNLLMRSTIERGELEPYWQREKQVPFLNGLTAAVAEVLGRPEPGLRLVVQTLNHLAVRYALSSPRELALVTGIHTDPSTEPTERDAEAAVRAVEDHLVAVARSMLEVAPTGRLEETSS